MPATVESRKVRRGSPREKGLRTKAGGSHGFSAPRGRGQRARAERGHRVPSFPQRTQPETPRGAGKGRVNGRPCRAAAHSLAHCRGSRPETGARACSAASLGEVTDARLALTPRAAPPMARQDRAAANASASGGAGSPRQRCPTVPWLGTPGRGGLCQPRRA